ncbi:MAG: hypothetical protein ACLPV4_08280 [Solirubrobacteraceae bacterium]
MSQTPAHRTSSLDERASAARGRVADGNAGSVPRSDDSGGEQPRLIEEHHIVGPHGEDQIEATDERGRRWYHLRPDPRSRYDFIGFNYTWWLIWVLLLFLIFAPWGRGWGY